MKKIGVVGLGYVGITTALVFADVGYQVVCIDKDKNKIKLLKDKKMPFYEDKCEDLLVKNYSNLTFTDNYYDTEKIDMFFICVGTPLIEKENVLDLKSIIEVIGLIQKNKKSNNDITICIRSTILPGTCEKIEKIINEPSIHIIHNPEFLSQGSAINDSINATRIVIGSSNDDATKNIYDMYIKFLKTNKKNIPILVMTRKEAEMVKFVANSYLAMRISFVNEISNLCEKINIDISSVVDGVKYDNRIGGYYFKCGIGYGGSCLPKDTKAITNFSIENDSFLSIVNATIEVNELQLKKCFNRIKQDFANLSKVNVAILGTTFKAKTDDIRNSCSLYLTEQLLKNKAIINVYDPKGLKAFKKIYGNSINYCENVKKCIEKCNIIIIATEWDEFKNYNYNALNSATKIYIYDFKSCLNRKDIINPNIKYWVVGGSNE